MAVPVLIDDVARGILANCSKPLRTIGSHPDEIACLHWIPTVAQSVDAAAFQHEQTVLHHMYFAHAQGRSGPIGHGVYGEVEIRTVREQHAYLQIGIAL